MRDMKSLGGLLTGSEWSIKKLALGDKEATGAYMSDDCVSYLFQHLPSVVALESLRIYYVVPEFMSRRILEGIKNNYSLEHLEGLAFASDPALEREVAAYVSANKRGRRIVHEAIANPDNRGRQEAALAVLHRLANSDDPQDDTVLLLCVQLLLPPRANKLTPPSHLSHG